MCTEGEGGLEIVAVRPERISNLTIRDIGAHVVRNGMLVGMQPNPNFAKLGVQRLPLAVDSAPCTTVASGVIEIVLVVLPTQNGSLDGLLVDYQSGRRMRTVRVPFHLKTCKEGSTSPCGQK